jgi:hypothetical protein
MSESSDASSGANAGSGAFSGAMAGLQFGSQLGAGYSAYQMQKLQNKYATEAAQESYDFTQDLLIKRTGEEARAFSQANVDRQRRAMELEAQANVAAGEAGIAGISVDAIQRNIKRQEGQVELRQKQSFESRMDAIEAQNQQALSTMVARMQGLTPPTQPNILAMAASSAAPFMMDSGVADSFDSWWGEKFGGTS